MLKTLMKAAMLTAALTSAGAGYAGQSCWGLEGEALKTCIAETVKTLCKISNPDNPEVCDEKDRGAGATRVDRTKADVSRLFRIDPSL